MRSSLLLVLLLACAPPDDTASFVATADTAAPLEGLRIEGVDYRLDWRVGDAILTEDGWSTTTDLGYEVHVSSGYSTAYSLALKPCDDDDLPDVLGMLGSLVVGTAWANHPVDDDPSALVTSLPEDLRAPAAVLAPGARFETTDYCGVHYAIGRADPDTWLPDDSLADGTSLRVLGTWERDGVAGTIDWDSAWAHGVVLPLPHGETDVAEIGIVRDLERLFDGLDFETATDEQAHWQVLSNLVDHATVDLDPR